MRKMLMCIFSIMVIFSTFGFFACNGSCNDNSTNEPAKIQIEGWNDESQTVLLGSMYWIEKPEAIVAGVKYEVETSVIDSKGNGVVLFKNTFDILDIDGYKIYFNAEVNGMIAQKIITLSVVDQKEPSISFISVKQGLVNEFFSFSQIIVTDQSQKEISKSFTLYLIDGNERTRVECNQSGFTPTVVGLYYIEVTATDESGNTCTKSSTFYIRNTVEENEIETFSDYGATETNFAFDGENFSGTKLKTAVSTFTRSSKSKYSISFNNNGLSNLVFFTEPRLEKDTLTNFLNDEKNYISFYIYIEDANNATQNVNYKNVPVKTVETNKWQEVILDKDIYGNATNFLVKQFFGKDFIEIFNIANSNNDNYTVYVDDIRIVDSSSNIVISNAETTYNLNDTITFNVSGGENVAYEILFNGKFTTITGTTFQPAATGYYTFIVEEKGIKNTGYDSYTFAVRSNENDFVISNEISTTITRSYITLGFATLNGNACNAKYYLLNYASGREVEVVNGKVSKDGLVAGSCLFYAVITVGNETLTDAVTLRLSEYDVKYVIVSDAGLYNDLSASFQKVVGAKSEREYLEEYQNAQSVWHITATQNDTFASMGEVMSGVEEKEYYQAHEKMIFRVMSDKSGAFVIYNDYPKGNVTDCTIYPMTAKTNIWTYYETDMTNVMKVYDRWQNRQSYLYCSTAREFYFDKVFAANIIDVESLSLSSVIVNKEYTINDNINDAIAALGVEISNLKLTVLLDNEEIPVVNGKFTVDKTGYLEIVYTGSDDEQLNYFGFYSVNVKDGLQSIDGLYNDLSASFQKVVGAKSEREYLEEYQNAQSVWHITATQNDTFAPMGEVMSGVVEKEYYQAHEKMIFRVMSDKSGAFVIYNDYPKGNVTDCTIYPMTSKTNIWTYYETDMTNVMKVYDRWQNRQSYLYCSVSREFYFDKVFAANIIDVESLSSSSVIINKEYTINDNINDAIAALGVEISNLKLTVLLDNEEIQVVNGKFTVDKTGYLEIIYTGIDDEERNYFGFYSLIAKESLIDETTGLYNDFSDSYSEVVGAKSGREWLSEFENATGVSKFYSTVNDAFVLISSNAVSGYWDKDYYLAHDKMVFRIYTDISQNMILQNDYGDNYLTGFTVSRDTEKAVGYWTDYEVPMSEFMTIWDRLQKRTSYVYCSQIRTIYIDSIYAVKTLNVVSNISDEIHAGSQVSVDDNISTVVANAGVELYELGLKVLLNNKEIPVVDGKFTPDESGLLEFIYTATDDNGLLYRGRYAYFIN